MRLQCCQRLFLRLAYLYESELSEEERIIWYHNLCWITDPIDIVSLQDEAFIINVLRDFGGTCMQGAFASSISFFIFWKICRY